MAFGPVFERGEQLGDLRIERELGAGAFGRVYLAHDALIGRDVALKVVPAGDDPRTRERALREARAIGRLSHPHIAALYRVHEPDHRRAWLFEMEYIAGGTLEEILRSGKPLPPERLEPLVRAVTDALAHAHARHVVHGDVKPSNILVGDDGSIKLVDFGLARLIGDLSEFLSQSDHPGGTPNFMAPEIFMGQEASPRSDVWSLGVLVYRLLTGRQPFAGRGFHGLFQAVLNREPEPLDRPAPAWLSRLVERCLVKDPVQRPASAGELATSPDAPAGPRPEQDTATHGQPRFGQGDLLRAAGPALEGLVKGRGSVLVVTGPAGAGKTALLRSIRSRCRRAGARWVECAVSELHGFQRPLLAALESAVGIPEAASAVLDISASTEKLVRALYGDDAETSLKDRHQLYWVLEGVLRRLAEQSPLCVAIEDAQFANEEDVGLIAHLARYLSRSGVLLVVTCRTERARARADSALDVLLNMSDVGLLSVEPLRGADLIALIENQFESTHIDRAVLRRVIDLSQGNPLVCQELVRNMLASGAALRRGARIVPGSSWETSRLPRRLRELTASRLAVVDDGDRHLLDIASVDGIDSDARAIASVTRTPVLDVMRALQRISRHRGILRPTETGYRFVSQIMRETVYEALSHEMRRAVHEALAEHLESRADEAGPERIGTHWSRAGRPDRARPHLRRAVTDALKRFEHSRAIALAADAGLDAGRMADDEILDHAGTLMELARAFLALGDPAAGIRTMQRIEAAARSDERTRLAMQAHIAGLVAQYQHVGRDSVSVEDLRTSIEAVGECGEAAQGLFLLGQIAKYEQRYDEAVRLHKDAMELARRLDDGAILAQCLNSLAGVSLRRGQLREAEALFHDAARIAEHAGRRESASASRVNAAIAAYRRGELDGLVPMLRTAIRQLSTQDSPQSSAGARVVLGNLLWSDGQPAEAERVAREAVAVAEAHGQLGVRTGALRLLAEITAARGDLDQARPIYRRALDLLERSGNQRISRTVHAIGMRIHLWAGSPEQAAPETTPCLEQLAHDAGEASSIALDLGEGIFYGLDADSSGRILDLVRSSRGSTPEYETAQHFVEMVWSWRFGDRAAVEENLGRFFESPLAYRRAQCHGMAAVIRFELAPTGADLGRLRARLDSLGHAWLQAYVSARFGDGTADAAPSR